MHKNGKSFEHQHHTCKAKINKLKSEIISIIYGLHFYFIFTFILGLGGLL